MRKVIISILFLLAISIAVYSAAPVVKNVRAQQRVGTRLVDITYDVSDPDGDTLTISVLASDDNGKTYNIVPKSLTGDVGKNIKSGNGKKITWDVGKDLPKTKSLSEKCEKCYTGSITFI